MLADVEFQRLRLKKLVANLIARQRHIVLSQEIVVDSTQVHKVLAFVE